MIELTVTDGPKAGADVLRSLDAAEIAIAGLALREPSLDDVFLSLTGHKTTIDEDDPGRGEAEEGASAGAARTTRPTERMPHDDHPSPQPAQLVEPEQGNRLSWAVADIVTMAKRNILAVLRTPEALFFTTLQPIMFVLLFTYVFGGAIHVPGGHYIDFLMPGIFVQTVDLRRHGLVGRPGRGPAQGHRSSASAPCPMSRSAVLAGRTTSDLVRNVFVVIADHRWWASPSASGSAPTSACSSAGCW